MKSDKDLSKKAAALKYDPEQNDAPILTAVGSGFVAERILEKAVENDIPIVTDSSVADVLSKFSVGDAIPSALYEAVAQILVFIASTDSSYQTKISGMYDK